MIRRLANELEHDYSDTDELFKMISKNQHELLSANIGGEKTDYLPKPDLKYKEYTAIKNFYSGADFERNSFLTLSLPLVSTVLWFT